jgi:abortive infection bacteriophage resistance protein
MKYVKPSLSYEQQAELLISRGLQANQTDLISSLKSISYYRLSGYLYPFRDTTSPEEKFKPQTSLAVVLDRYSFDRELRLLIFSAIERIEIGIRTNLIHSFSLLYGPFGYIEASHFPQMRSHSEWLENLKNEKKRSRETFLHHFENKYGDEHSMPPVWMIAEVISFGNLVHFYEGIETNLQQSIANEYKLPRKVLASWLLTLNTVRNICAHHARIWNRRLGVKPEIPRAKNYPDWHSPIEINNDRVFCILVMISYLLHIIAPNDDWSNELAMLLDKYPSVPIQSMGFPNNWTECPIWKI